MKESAGEANMTVVTIILIGVVVAIATPIVSNVMQSAGDKADCVSNGGSWDGNACVMP